MNLFFFIAILVVLILVHEFGHLVAAKLLGVKVEEFAIGFPPRLGKIRKGETDYSFNLLLFGGYVRMLGENEHPGAADNLLSDATKDPRSFAFKSGWTQAGITLAGVAMNGIFAWLAFIVVFMAGVQVDASNAAYPQHLSNQQVTIEAVAPNSPALAADITSGDVIIGAKSGAGVLQGKFTSADFQQFTASHQNDEIMLTVEHGKDTKIVSVKPAFGLVPGRAAIGVELADLAVERLPLSLAVVQGSESTWAATKATVVGLSSFFGSVLTGHGNFSDVAGPVGIARLGAESVAEGFSAAMLFAAIISINLALLNLLPIPGLDGGRLLFIVIERIKGSAIHPQLATRITIAGFAFLIALMLIVTYHDIARLI